MDLVYILYFCLKRFQKGKSEKGKFSVKYVQKMIDYCEWYYNVLLRKWYIKFPLNQSGINQEKRKERIIVSLTSYPKRIDNIWLVVETLLRQSMKPDEVILWLAEEQFNGLESLPDNLLRLQRYGLTIRFCDDLRSHKKYYYVMQEYSNDLIVLADDDMFYPRDMIKKLMKLHKKYPHDICCSTVQVIERDRMPSQWRNPKVSEKFEHSKDIQIFTGSGSLFPANSLDLRTFDKELMMKLAPHADDLWLTYMALKKNTYITALYPWRAFPIEIYGTSVGSLWYVNAQDGQNDVQWKKIRKYFEGDI